MHTANKVSFHHVEMAERKVRLSTEAQQAVSINKANGITPLYKTKVVYLNYLHWSRDCRMLSLGGFKVFINYRIKRKIWKFVQSQNS